MKHLCVFGGGGRTGVEVVTEALRRGYQVTACVYSDAAKEYLPSEASVIVCDVTNHEQVMQSLVQCDTVISVVGHVSGSDPRMQTKGISNILAAMQEKGIQRIVSLTGTGVRMSGDKVSLLDRIANFLVRFIDRDRVMDGVEHARLLLASSVDWTIVRVLKLSQGDTDGVYRLSEHGPAEKLTSRKKVAKVLVDMAEDTTWIHKSPIVSG